MIPSTFVEAAEPIIRRKVSNIDKTVMYRRWMSCFGARPEVMVELWKMISPDKTMPHGAEPKHMTWAFYFLKQYSTEEVLSVNLGDIDEQTIRKWVWLFVDAISFQEYRVVSIITNYEVIFAHRHNSTNSLGNLLLTL